MNRLRNITCLLGVLWLSLGIGQLWGQGDPIQETLREHIERLRALHTLTVGQSRIASVILLPALYERRNFRLLLNPTWTVPPSILAHDILPAVRRDRSYLQKRNLKVIDRSGRVVDPSTVNWARYQAQNFPYQLRQDPGPNNALGRIKFMFPNPHLVYLHDTPSRELFDRPERAFSSGCIRVENPFELAELLLNDPINWSRNALLEAAASNVTQTVFLPVPIPVLLLYWTVDVSQEGIVTFKPDMYERDKAVLAGLRGEFTFRKRPILRDRVAGVERPSGS